MKGKHIDAKVNPRDKRRGLTVVFTGDGQGKTTASLGVLIRAYGRGLKGIMLQFIKSEKSEYGEHLFAKKIGISIMPLGDGFTWDSPDLEKDKALAKECWQKCKNIISSSEYDLVILDELTYPINFGWLDLKEVIETLQNKPKWMHIIITGREAPKDLIDVSDTVTEMREIKHALKKGITAQAGIEL